MLESVVEVGTGRQGSVPGYRVGGKTGTAQAADGKGGYSGITASFIGVAPIEDPQIAVSVIIHRPRVGEWGSQVNDYRYSNLWILACCDPAKQIGRAHV